MSQTFSQIYIQVVFAVQGRQNLIQKSWKDELHKYISGIITEKNQKSIIGLLASQAIPSLICNLAGYDETLFV